MAETIPRRSKRPKTVVADTLAGRILSGQYRAGELLPPESELLAEFGVSRTCMREALQMLGAKGLVTSRPRIGTTVVESIYWNHLDADMLRWRQGIISREALVRELFAMRRLVEPEAAALAAGHIDAATLARLQEALFDMARGNGERTRQAIEADIAFHRILLAANGNALIAGFGAVIEEALRISIEITSAPENSIPMALDMHIAVFEAVQTGDGPAARNRMTALLDATADALGRAGYDCGPGAPVTERILAETE